jgi:hypothetical protein
LFLALLLLSCGSESWKPNEGRAIDDRASDGDASAEGSVTGAADSEPLTQISVTGTLVERLLNAPSKTVNETSWEGVANGRYLLFALYGDGFGSVSEIGLTPTDFSWVPSGEAAVVFSGNPWFGDLTIVELSDPRTLIASSDSGGVFGQRWVLIDRIPGR